MLLRQTRVDLSGFDLVGFEVTGLADGFGWYGDLDDVVSDLSIGFVPEPSTDRLRLGLDHGGVISRTWSSIASPSNTKRPATRWRSAMVRV